MNLKAHTLGLTQQGNNLLEESESPTRGLLSRYSNKLCVCLCSSKVLTGDFLQQVVRCWCVSFFKFCCGLRNPINSWGCWWVWFVQGFEFQITSASFYVFCFVCYFLSALDAGTHCGARGPGTVSPVNGMLTEYQEY